jgi:hypothetical protein
MSVGELVATPFDSVAVPRTVVPSLNVTEPVGVPVVDELTVAVNVGCAPSALVALEVMRLIPELACVTVRVPWVTTPRL